MNAKQACRQVLRARRDSLTSDEQAQRSATLWQNFLGHPAFAAILQPGTSIGLYAAVRSEVRTDGLCAALRARQVICCFPRVQQTQLVFAAVASYDMLQSGTWGIGEPPADAVPVGLDRLSMLVVPGLGFDARLHRLGYGRGYYDRILAAYGGVSVGLAYEVQRQVDVPLEDHDRAVDWLVTEGGVWASAT